MHALAVAALAGLTALAEPGHPPDRALPAGPIELEGHPLRIAAIERAGGVDVLLLDGRELGRFRLDRRTLVRTASHRAPARGSRPLLLDAAPPRDGGAPLVTAVFGDDVRGVDQGTDTTLHALVLSAAEDGLRPVSHDLRAYLRIAGGTVYLQRRGLDAPFAGQVHPVEEAGGRYAPAPAALPWAGRWLLDATPLPGGAEALAWEDDRPVVVGLESGARVPGGSLLRDLGEIDEPRIAVRVERPILKGLDAEGKTLDRTHALPRRVVVAGGGAYTVLRERSKRLLGKTSGQDAVVRLDWSDGTITLSRPFPGVEAFVLDFALLERAGGPALAVLLLNEKDDGSGRAHLLFQEAQ